MDRIEIRLLGPLRVRRSDGSLVDPREWRTHKTAELLMLLALHAGEPVPTHRLLEALWPDADPDRGRASLRTALSRLRSALREDPFDRDPRGPVLSGVWVDSQVFDELAARAHRAWEQAQPDEAFVAATEADSLCLSHLVPDATGGWAAEYAGRHLATHRDLLGDAGEAALALLRPREAAELADRLVALDPLHERACRTLMLAASAMGEVDRALQAYQSCAQRLAEELGADPSSQTRAVYLQVLRAGPVAGRPIPFVGRAAELEALCAQLSKPDGGRMLIVHGEQGMGTTSLIEQALAAVGTVEVARGDGARLSGVLETAARQHRETGRWPVLAVDRLNEADAASLVALEELVLSGALALATCPTSTLGGPTALATALVRAGAAGAVWKLRVRPLTDKPLRELASVLLAGEPGDELAAQLLRLSRGRPGKAVALLEGWLARGSVVGSGRDLALVAPGTTSTAAESRQIVARMQERVAGPAYEVLEAAAALGDHASPELLAAMTGGSADQVRQALQELSDLRVVTEVRGQLRVHDPLLRTALLAWLRPSVRRALHGRAAGLEGLAHEARAAHWRAADVPGEAASSALAAAEELASAGRLEEACELLRAVLEDATELDPALRLHLAERLGDHLAQHGAGEAASRVYDAAIRDADEQGLDGIGRLAVKSQAPLGRHTPHLSVAEASVSTAGPPSPVPDAHELEDQLRVRIESAQRASERELAVIAQIELCALVLTPQRRLDELARVAAEAQFLAPTAQLRAQVVLAAAEPEVLLGGASRWVSVLLEAVTTAPGDVSLATGLPPGRLLALAMHDLGQDGTVGVPRGGGWLMSRILLERGDLSATAALRPSPTGGVQPCAVVLELLTRAQIVLADDRSRGRELLRQALDLSLGLGTSLLLPEVAARLAAEEVDDDEESALEHLDLAEFTLGEVAMPRERVLLLLGRAAVRAQHKGPRAAAEVARKAAHVATRAGLVHLAHEAERVVSAYEQTPAVIALSPPVREHLAPRALNRR